MDIRKLMAAAGNPAPPRQSKPSTNTTRSAPNAQSGSKSSFTIDDDDDDEIVVIKKASTSTPTKLQSNTIVQLPPPNRSLGSSLNKNMDDGPSKSDRNAQKRKRQGQSDTYSESSSSSSSSGFSGSSSSSGSESFFSESDFADEDDGRKGPKKSNREAQKKAKAAAKNLPQPKVLNHNHLTSRTTNKSSMGDSSGDDKRKKKSTTTTTTTTTTAAAPKKTPVKKPPTGVTSADYDYHDIAIVMMDHLPAPSKMVIDPRTGKQAPSWLVTLPTVPPPLKGQRPRPIGASNSLATGGGGPNAKNRNTPFTFVLTGTLTSLEREEAEDLIKSLGGKITGAPSGRTDFLLKGDEPGPSKVNKAIDNGTYIIDEDGLFKLIMKKNPQFKQPAGLFFDGVSNRDDEEAEEPNGRHHHGSGSGGTGGSSAKYERERELQEEEESLEQQHQQQRQQQQQQQQQQSQQPKQYHNQNDIKMGDSSSLPIPSVSDPVAPSSAPKKGSLYARKAPGALVTPSTTTTTATTSDSSLSSTQTMTQSLPISSMTPNQSINSLTSSSMMMGDQITPTGSATAKKPSLYARKSGSVTPSSSPLSTTTTSSSSLSTQRSTQDGVTTVDFNQLKSDRQIETFDISKLPQIATYPGTTENDLWVDRFKPTDAKDIVGNTNDVDEIIDWLKKWHYYDSNNMFTNGPKPPKWRPGGGGSSNSEQPLCRAILLSGGPGVGKTTAATLCAKAAGLTAIAFNASDTRSQNAIREHVGVLTDGTTLGSYCETNNPNNNNPNMTSTSTHSNNQSIRITKPLQGTGSVIIMDEVDGVSASDRGGIAELIKIIQRTKAPIICICNDAKSDKVKSLKNYCRTYTWARPRATQVARRLKIIAHSQGLKIQDSALEEIYKNTNSDIRATINYLQMMATTRRGTVVTYQDAQEQKTTNVKDCETNPFEVVPKFYQAKSGTKWFREAMNNIYVAQDLLPMYMFENYLCARPNTNFGKQLPQQQIQTTVDQKEITKLITFPKQSYQPKLLPKTQNQKKNIIPDFSIPFIPPQPTTITNRPFIPTPPPTGSSATSINLLRTLTLTGIAADAMSLGSEMETAMMNDQAFHLWPLQSTISTIYPGQTMGSGLGGMIQFPLLLGNISSMNKAIRVSTLIRTFFSILSTPLSKKELILNYIPTFHSKLLAILTNRLSFSPELIRQSYGEDYCKAYKADKYLTGLEAIAHLLTFLGMTKEDFDLMLEPIEKIIEASNNSILQAFHSGPSTTTTTTTATKNNVKVPQLSNAIQNILNQQGKKEKKNLNLYSNLETRMKSNLTRTLNKLADFNANSKGKKSTTKGKGGGVSTDGLLTEDQLLELANNELVLTSDDDNYDESGDNDDNNGGDDNNSQKSNIIMKTNTTTKKTASTARGVKKRKQ